MPIEEAHERMVQFAAKKVAEAQSIFKGRIIKVEYIGPDEEYPVIILTYEVDAWLKGNGKRHAKIVYEGWCDGPCPNIQRMMDRLQYDHPDNVYIADQPNRLFVEDNPSLPKDIDGVFGLCSNLGRSVQPINKPLFYPRFPHRSFLFEIVVTSEIEKLSPKIRIGP